MPNIKETRYSESFFQIFERGGVQGAALGSMLKSLHRAKFYTILSLPISLLIWWNILSAASIYWCTCGPKDRVAEHVIVTEAKHMSGLTEHTKHVT